MCFTVNPRDYSPTRHYRILGPAPRNAGDLDQGIHFDLVHDDHQVDSLTAQLSPSFTFQMFLALDYEFKDIIVTLTCIWHQDTQKGRNIFMLVS